MSQDIKRGLPYDVMIAKESVYGTKPGSVLRFPGRLTNFTETIVSEEILSSLLSSQNEADQAFHGADAGGWGCDFELVTGEIIAWVMGADAISGTDPYTHDLTLANDIPSLALEAIPEDMPESRDFLGGKMNSFSLSAAVNEIVTGSIEAIGKNPVKQAAPTTPAQIAGDPFIFHQGDVQVGGVQYEDVLRGFNFDIGRSVVGIPTFGVPTFKDVKEGRRSGTLTLEIYPDSNELLDIQIGQAPVAAQLLLDRATNDTIQFDFASTKAFSLEPAVGEEAYLETLPLRIIGDWTCTVINDETPAYI